MSARSGASESPDGLEYVGGKLGFLAAEPPPSPIPSPMAGYELPLAGRDHVKLATALALLRCCRRQPLMEPYIATTRRLASGLWSMYLCVSASEA